MKKVFGYLALAAVVFAIVLAIFSGNAEAAPLQMPDGTIFDPTFYADSYQDLKTTFGYNGGQLWKHYNTFGRREGRICTASNSPVASVNVMSNGDLFDAAFYAASNPDVVAIFGTSEKSLFNHYSRYGKGERRLAYPGQTFLGGGAINTSAQYPYYIRINRAAATVTVYGMDMEGNYSIPYKAFVCSPGVGTPIGTFRSAQNARWLAFDGGQYGQYAKRITGHIWFHSVMYNGRSASNLDWNAYNKLGTICSHGCIRLQAGDAKWIFDNCPVGTTVEIYDDATNPGPLGKPEAMKLGASDVRRGWDPTDPDPANPWNK